MLQNIPFPNTLLTNPDGTVSQPWYLFFSGQNTFFGTGVPPATMGANGNYYFRSDGGVGTHIYFKSGGAWTAIV